MLLNQATWNRIPATPEHYVFVPKPLEAERLVLTKRATRAPMPDTTLDDPEPVIEMEPIEEPTPEGPVNDAWTLAPSHAPAPVQDVIRLNEGTPGVVVPVITRRVQPDYPKRGLQMRMQGYVILDAVLRADGTVGAVTVLQGLGKGRFGFEEMAIEAVRQWRFIPGSYRGKPADIHLNLKITFQLQ
jgi:TonB family protein